MFNDLEPAVFKTKEWFNDLQFITWFNRQFYYSSLPYFHTISTNIPNVEKNWKDTQVWCCKKL